MYALRQTARGRLAAGGRQPPVGETKAETLASRFRLGTPYLVVPTADITTRFHDVPGDPNSGWADFYKRYPDSGGFMIVSAVGFDASKERAMVYMAHQCGLLCGGGTHHFLGEGRRRLARGNASGRLQLHVGVMSLARARADYRMKPTVRTVMFDTSSERSASGSTPSASRRAADAHSLAEGEEGTISLNESYFRPSGSRRCAAPS